MMGDRKNPKLTDAVLKGGWYHTGDMGYMDEDGNIFMTDRKADIIISGGENVYPKEVEDIIYQHRWCGNARSFQRPMPNGVKWFRPWLC